MVREELLEKLEGISDEVKEEIADAFMNEYERGRDDMASELDKRLLDEGINEALTASGAYDTAIARSVMNLDAISMVDGDIAGIKEEIERLKTEYAFMFRQEHPQFVPDKSGDDEMDISALNYLERLALFKENPDLYKLHMNK